MIKLAIFDVDGTLVDSGMTIHRALEASLGYDVVGPHVPIGEPTVETRSYSVLDLGASWVIAEGQAVDVEVGNLLDVRYVELRSAGYVTPGAPRSVRMQLRLTRLPF